MAKQVLAGVLNIEDGVGDGMHVLRLLDWYLKLQKTRKDLPELIICLAGNNLYRILIEAIDMGLINYDRTKLKDFQNSKDAMENGSIEYDEDKLNDFRRDIEEEIMELNPHLILSLDTYARDEEAKEGFFKKLAGILDNVSCAFEISTYKLSQFIWRNSKYEDESYEDESYEDANKIIHILEKLRNDEKFFRYLEFNAPEAIRYWAIKDLLSNKIEGALESLKYAEYLADKASTTYSMGVGYYSKESGACSESPGVPVRIVDKNKQTQINSLQALLKNNALNEVLEKYGYIKEESESEEAFLKKVINEVLFVPCYLQGLEDIGYHHYFRSIYESPLAQEYKHIVFVTNNADNVDSFCSALPDNVHILKTFLELEDYKKLLNISQAFSIVSGDNSLINALDNLTLPIIIDKNDKSIQLALMLEYIQNKELNETMDIGQLCNWLHKFYHLFSSEEDRKIGSGNFTDPFKEVNTFLRGQANLNNITIEELEAIEYKSLGEFSNLLTRGLLEQWRKLVEYLSKYENLFDRILEIITSSVGHVPNEHVDDSYLSGDIKIPNEAGAYQEQYP